MKIHSRSTSRLEKHGGYVGSTGSLAFGIYSFGGKKVEGLWFRALLYDGIPSPK